MAKRLTGTILALTLCLGGAMEVHAQTSCVVLGVEAVNAPPPLAARLSQEIASRVKNSHQYTLKQEKDLEEIKLIFGCLDEDPGCMANAGKSLQTETLIWGTLKKTPAGYNFTIKLLNVKGARIEKFLSENYSLQELDVSKAAAVVAKLTSDFLVSSRGSIRLFCNRSGAQIFLGDRAVGISEHGVIVIQEVLPGTHELRVTMEGYQPWSQRIIVESGKAMDVRANVEPIVIPPPAPATQPEIPTVVNDNDRRDGWKTAFWASLAVTLAATIVATPMGIQAWASEDELQNLLKNHYIGNPGAAQPDACESYQSEWGPPGDVQEVCDNGKTQSTLSTAFFITAGVAAMATAVFGYLAFSGESKATSTEPREESAAWRLVPSASPQGASVDFSLRF